MNSPKVYYGLVSTGTSLNDTWLPLNSGFILGIGWIGTRASAGLDIPASFGLSDPEITSDTAAHEIGHNLGRYHAPCDTASGLDNELPRQHRIDRAVRRRCQQRYGSEPQHHQGCDELLRAAVGFGLHLQGALCRIGWNDHGGNQRYSQWRACSFAAAFGPDGTASLAPAYGIMGVPDAAPNASGYRVEFLDAAGNVVSSQPVAVNEIEQPHVVALAQGKLVPQTNALSVRGMDTRAPQLAINAIVAAPAQAFSSMRLVRAGTRAGHTRAAPGRPGHRRSRTQRRAAGRWHAVVALECGRRAGTGALHGRQRRNLDNPGRGCAGRRAEHRSRHAAR